MVAISTLSPWIFVALAIAVGGLLGWSLMRTFLPHHATPSLKPASPDMPARTAHPSTAPSPRKRSAPTQAQLDAGDTILVPYRGYQDGDEPPEKAKPTAPTRGLRTAPPRQTQVDTEADEGQTTTHMQALLLLQQGKLDSAWARFEQLPHTSRDRALLEPLDRLALGFEHVGRYDRSRSVYERMAGIDPNYRDIKPRLVRARGLAINVAATNSGLRPVATPVVPALSQLGRFIVESEIGRGSMGAIYLARDPNLDRLVALKTMALSKEFEGADLEEARVRFFREAQMAGRLSHPDIVSIYDSGEQDGLAYIAMEYIEGKDLSAFTDPAHLLPATDLILIMARAAEALFYAHSRGVTHRDIKPANIMINIQSGAVKITDFGVARISDSSRTRTGMVLGTPSFMSPEQLAGQRVDGRSDLYSLGVSMFQLLTGTMPFENKSMALLMRSIANDPAPDIRQWRPDLPEALANVVAISLEKRPEVRYADGHQMAQDLRALVS